MRSLVHLAEAERESVRLLELRLGSPEAAPVPTEVLESTLSRLPRLRLLRIVLAPPWRLTEADWVPRLVEICRRRRLDLAVELSIPARAAGAGARQLRSELLGLSRSLAVAGLAVRWIVRASGGDVYALPALCSLADETGAELVVAPPRNHAGRPAGDPLGAHAAAFLRDFLELRLLAPTSSDPAVRLHHRRLLRACAATRRTRTAAPRPIPTLRLLLAPGGSTELQPSTEDTVERDWEAASWTPLARLLESCRHAAPAVPGAELPAAIAVLVRGAVALLLSALPDARRLPTGWSEASPPRLPVALLIGAYGGEHVGDTAILGGVLLRLHRRHATERVDLLSFRPHHTRRLLEGIRTPVTVRVLPYELSEARRSLQSCDCLVFAGGPLMDLPRLLVRHLHVAAHASRLGRPFLIESVGVGPFRRLASRLFARRIAGLATRLSVRTTAAASAPAVAGLGARVHRDAAFTYLATRRVLDRLSAASARSVEELLEGANRPLIGLNLRPIRHDWDPHGAAHSRAAEEGLFQELGRALSSIRDATGKPPTLVFFPMNSIQFGYSDLDAVPRLLRHLAPDVDLRVWEWDPEVDAVLHLLGQLDLAVTMRLHAAIFALSRSLPLLAIDYYVASGGKVGELFADLGRPQDVCRIDTFRATWLLDGVRRHLASGLSRRGR